MKRTKLIFVMLLGLSAMLVMPGCQKDSPVAFTEKASFTIPALVAPASGGFISVTGTTVDLKWETTNADNAPAKFDVYFGSSDDPSRVETNYTSLSRTVNVLPGVKYYWRVVATDANNVISRGPLWSFEVIDPAAAPKLKMTWTTDVKSVVGLDLAPDAAVNLRLLILKADKVTNAATPVNTASFEEFAGFNTLVDGTYYVVTDIASTINAGDFNKSFNININLAFNQRGSYNQSLAFDKVMTNKFNCSAYKTVLATIVKTGNTYTMDKAVSNILPAPPAVMAGTWHGSDFGYASTVVTTIASGKLLIDGVGTGWMSDPVDGWGEVPQQTWPAEVVLNLCAGTVTIANQKFMETKYKGELQPLYYIQGSGTYTTSGAFPTLKLSYDFIQSGSSIAKYFGVTAFTATLTLDPAAKTLLLDPTALPRTMVVKPGR